MSTLIALAETLWAVAIALCLVGAAFAAALRLLPDAPVSVRWSATAVIAAWLAIAVFLVLASVSSFRPLAAVAVWVALAASSAWIVGARRCFSRLGRDWRTAAGVIASLPQPLRWVLLAVSIVAGARLARGLVAPPLGWDALTYHLLKAGRWVQSAAMVSEEAPDAWGYYEYFAPYGDVLWAWSMLLVRGDALLAPAGALIWLALTLAVYTTARSVGSEPRWAAAGALVVASSPAVLNYLTAAYVDNTAAAMILLASPFVIRTIQGTDRVSAVLAGGALGLAAGVKVSALPHLVIGLAAVSFAIAARGRQRDKISGLLAMLVAAAIVVPPYARAWVERGSPLYPLSLTIAGVTILEGNPEMDLVHSGALLAETGAQSWVGTMRKVLLPEDTLRHGLEFLGLGPAAALLLPTAVMAAWSLRQRREHRWTVVFLMVSGVVTLLAILPASNTALRTAWADVLGRHLIVPMAIGAVLTVSRPGRWTGAIVLAALAFNLPLTLPLGWSARELSTLGLCAVWFGLALALYRLWRTAPAPYTRPAGVAFALAAILPYAIVLEWRTSLRYDYYALAAARGAYDVHRLNPAFAASWPLWKALDAPEGATVAVSAGWDGVGHNWYQYPFLGQRLQNRVIYVPVTDDGRVVDYRLEHEVAAASHASAWLSRLVAAGADYVAILPPVPPEDEFVRARPDLFRRHTSGANGSHATLYRLDRTPSSW